MYKYKKLSTFLVIFGIGLFALVLSIPQAFAEDNYFFRIDTELDVPAFFGSSGPTITWKCNGTGQGIVTDNTASESVQALDAIIKVASTSVENNASHAGCDASEAITATASFDGWLSRTVTGTVSAVGSNITFTMRASADYTIVVNGVTDELSNTLTLNGTTASATYSGTVASQSYSGGKRYIAGSTSGGTVKGGANGYVNRTSSALTISATASQSVDFGTTDNSTLNESGLSFGHKITVNESGGGSITKGTVLAGDSSGTTCTAGTGSNAGNWFCAVPLANTATTATFRHDDWESATATYTDRTTGSDAQNTATINAFRKPPTGTYYPLSTLTPTPSPSLTPTPSPTPELTPIPTPTPEPQTIEGKMALIRAKILELQARLAELLGQKNLPTPPVQAPPAYGLFNFTRALHSGIRGEDVKALQDYLKSSGHLGSDVESTGYFGQLTKEAVSSWQRDNGVSPAEGYFGFRSQLKYQGLTK